MSNRKLRDADLDTIMKVNFYKGKTGMEKLILNEFADSFRLGIRDTVIQCNVKLLNYKDIDNTVACNTSNICNKKLKKFEQISKDQFNVILKSMNDMKSPGFDNLRLRDIKEYEELQSVVLNIINESIKLNMVPNLLKIGLIKPLFKKGAKKTYGSYTPLQLLPTIDKILEKVIYQQTMDYLETNNLLNEFQ